MKKIKFSGSQGAWIRLGILGLTLLNQALYVLGYETIPITDDQLADFLNLSILIGVTFYTSWKNNSVTKIAKYRDKVADEELEKALRQREEIANRDTSKVDKMEKK